MVIIIKENALLHETELGFKKKKKFYEHSDCIF